MKRLAWKAAKRLKPALCLLLTMTLISGCLCAEGLVVTASGKERVFDIGINPESVTATLEESGLLTVGGSGQIRDFTPETAPFAGLNVTAVKIGADVTVLGNYTFYNCGGLSGTVTLPKGLVRIGDGAFSGESPDMAPKPVFVENPFSQALVTRKKETASFAPAQEEEAESGGTEPSSDPSAPAGTEEAGNRYVIEEITQQEIGSEIFYPRTDGAAFTCSAENQTFRGAMTGLGYREATAMIPAAFDCGEGVSSGEAVVTKSVPVVDGEVILPDGLPEFSGPDGGELFSYAFGGWTESKDAADTVRAPGSVFPVGERTELYFIANWNRGLLVKISVKRDGEATVFAVPDLAEYEAVSFRWQSCLLETGEEPPADQEALAWEDIPGATEQSYRRENQPGDGGLLFRCVVELKRRQNLFFALFSGDQGEELALGGVRSAAGASQESLSFSPGTCEGVAISGEMTPISTGAQGYVTVPECGYICSDPANTVFNGWLGSDGESYDPGEIVKMPKGGLVLTAQWAAANTVFIKAGGTGGSGTQDDPFHSLTDALNRVSGDSLYTARIVLLSDVKNDGVSGMPETLAPASGGVTITSRGPGKTGEVNRFTLTLPDSLKLGGSVRFEDVILQNAKDTAVDIHAEGHSLVMGQNTEIQGEVRLFGKNSANASAAGAKLILESGDYAAVYGGGAEVHVSGGTVRDGLWGGGQTGCEADMETYISGGEVGNVYGGSETGADAGASLVVITGDARVSGWVYGGISRETPGNRTVVVRNLAGTLHSIHCADLVQMTNSEVTLAGDGSVDAKQPCLEEVGDLRLCSSVLELQSEVSELGALGNYDADGNVSSDESCRSTVRAAPGLLLQVHTAAAGYGPVSGVFWLDMIGTASAGVGVQVEAAESSETGDGTNNTGAFLKPATQSRAMTSGKVAGSHSFWQLGGSALERSAVLSAPHSESGGQATIAQTVLLPATGSGTIYKITKFQKTGNFSLILPTETEGSAVLPQGTGDGVYALRVEPTGTGWTQPETSGSSGAYLLTQLPQGEASWNSGVEGVWNRGETYPASAAEEGEITFSLTYQTGYEEFLGGEIDLVFQEYPKDGPMDKTTVKNTVLVKLTLEGDRRDIKQTAAVAPGRTFSDFTGGTVEIQPRSAVTACFQTEYYPTDIGAENMYLNFFQGTGETVSPAYFPPGTRLTLADMTDSGEYRYYSFSPYGENRICLAQFTGEETYLGPTDTTSKRTEKLLFAVDFSNLTYTGLPSGEYFLTLTHNADQQPLDGTRAAFSIGETGSYSLEISKEESAAGIWALTVTPQVPETDSRYAGGASISLSLAYASGAPTSFPSSMEIAGDGKNALRGQANIFFIMAANTPGRVVLDLTAVPESALAAGEYQLIATMMPRSGLQTENSSGMMDATAAPVAVSFAPQPVETTQESRAISVSLSGESQRLVDASEAAVTLNFALRYEDIEAGDRLAIDLLRKTGSTPEESSYTAVGNADSWTVSPQPGEISGTAGEVRITVPKGQESGTYRLVARVVDASGKTVAKQPYNFIVK